MDTSPAQPSAILLASASPARAATLDKAGLRFTTQTSQVDESALSASLGPLPPSALALALAQAKARDVAASTHLNFHPESARDHTIVVGCDSILEFEGQAWGKPHSPEDAVQRWQRMRGKSGTLHTGHWLIQLSDAGPHETGPHELGAVASTEVQFAELSDDEIQHYVRTREPLFVAGAFTVDGLGGAFITGISGDFHNVVGISLPLLRSITASWSISWPSFWRAQP